MKVLLISVNTEQINMPVLPMGLACVAASIDNQGHTVKMLNLMMQTDTQRALYGTIADFNPEIIGISVRNIDDQNMENRKFLLETVKEVMTNCRKYSDATIVLGSRLNPLTKLRANHLSMRCFRLQELRSQVWNRI